MLAFDIHWNIPVVMADAPHGTAPLWLGKNLANPMAMILASTALLRYVGSAGELAGRAISEAVLEALAEEGRTTTTEFTDDVIQRVRTKLAFRSEPSG